MSADPRQLLPSITRLLQRADVIDAGCTWGAGIVRALLDRVLVTARGDAARFAGSSRDDVERDIVQQLQSSLLAIARTGPRRVINATGVLLHTGLGRAPLSSRARQAVVDAAGACQLEIDPETGERCHRGFQVRELLSVLTGADESLIVNNNAGATLLMLQALCRGREVLISRGQLVEIGGSFRLPAIFETAGVTLREVGTTNRTHVSDYASAMTDRTAAILRVHASNYRIVGFTTEPSISELRSLASDRGVWLFDDLGSGQPCPTDALRQFHEPDFQSSIAAGADLVLGSGDKLLGGPQAGIILGRRDLISQLRDHPLARCLRIDKLNLAALYATLLDHARAPAQPALPLHQMLMTEPTDLRQRAEVIAGRLNAVLGAAASVVETAAEVGGGSCAGVSLPSVAVGVRPNDGSADDLAMRLRMASPTIGTARAESHATRPAVWSRVADGQVLLDLRSVDPLDDDELCSLLIECVTVSGDA